MKKKRTNIFIAITSVALLIVMIIQVNWIFQTAKIKEELFNEKANMVLSRTTEAISSDKETCMKIGACVDEDNNPEPIAKLGRNEVHKIDSLFNHYMNFYKIQVDYSYIVLKPRTNIDKTKNGFTNYIYNIPSEEAASETGFKLKLIFPDKNKFIYAEIGKQFITSIVLILFVLILFWRTVLSLMKEKIISEHTTDFLNNMTHEFKTPLTNIALASKMIIKDSANKQDGKIKHYSEIILEENEKLRIQVEQVLSMTALERGEIPLRKTEIDFHELIKESLKYISIQIDNKNGTISLNLTAEKFKVEGDKTHLTNAICNLIDNAIKYSKEKPELTIQTYNLGPDLTVIVSDSGIGIDSHFQKKVFDKFFRIPTGDVHDVKGFGIGLAYVKKIIELHEGTIMLHSEKGKGTSFTITLANV